MSHQTPTPAGWYDDPAAPQRLRYWDGVRWTEHASPKPVSRPVAPPLWSSYGGAAVCVQVLLALVAVENLLGAALEAAAISWTEHGLAGSKLSLAAGRRFDALHAATGAVDRLLVIATAAAFITWLYQAHRSDRMDRSVLRHTSGWAIGGWFVPILNLWRPLETVQDVWRGARSSSTGRAPEGTAVIVIWWIVFLVARFTDVAAVISGRLLAGQHDEALLSGAELTYALLLAGDVLSVAAVVLAILVVRRVTAAVLRAPAGTWYV